MQLANSILLATALLPLAIAWWSNRRTALAHAVDWAIVAWAAWLLAYLFGGDGLGGRYLALSLTGCAGIAVLGARRPHVGAWNFVVAGLLAVLLLPLAQGWGKQPLSVPALVFLGGTIVFGWLNYLPTRLLAAALLFGFGISVELAKLFGLGLDDTLFGVGRLALALSPWVALASFALKRREVNVFDREWLAFRDRFGVVWGQRSREQFNRAAANAGWPVTLSWHGLEIAADRAAPSSEEMLGTLRAVLKRFGEKEMG